MRKVRFIGLDVHKESIVIAVADEGGAEPSVLATIGHEMKALLKQLRRLGSSSDLRVCYEAGPTGYGLARALKLEGIDCKVIAPSLIPKKSNDLIKTDRRDAMKLARFLRSGDLTEVHIPDEETEAVRDLERARDGAKKAERVARHHLGKFLLRHGRRYEGKSWTKAHLEWIRKQSFEHEAHHRVLVDYVMAVERATARVVQLTTDLTEVVASWSRQPVVKALQALRGIDFLSAVILVAELGDLNRFDSAPKLMAYLGLIPSEHTSGGPQRQGRITRTGNTHARRILVESAWSYRFGPQMSPTIKKRNDGLSPQVQDTAWKAQQRLCGRYKKLSARGKNKKRVVTAIARELAGFVWSIARQPILLAA